MTKSRCKTTKQDTKYPYVLLMQNCILPNLRHAIPDSIQSNKAHWCASPFPVYPDPPDGKSQHGSYMFLSLNLLWIILLNIFFCVSLQRSSEQLHRRSHFNGELCFLREFLQLGHVSAHWNEHASQHHFFSVCVWHKYWACYILLPFSTEHIQ